jgi:hypothetical protein
MVVPHIESGSATVDEPHDIVGVEPRIEAPIGRKMSKFDTWAQKPVALSAWRRPATPLVLSHCGIDRMKGLPCQS